MYNRRSIKLNIFVTHSQSLLSGYWSRIDSILMCKKSNRAIFHTIIYENIHNEANIQIEQTLAFRASLAYTWGYWGCYLSLLVSWCFLVEFSQDMEQLSLSEMWSLIELNSHFLGMRLNAAVSSTNSRHKGCFLRFDIWWTLFTEYILSVVT